MRYTKAQMQFLIQKAVKERVRTRRFRTWLLFTVCVTGALLFGTYYPDTVKSGITHIGESVRVAWLDTKGFFANLFK